MKKISEGQVWYDKDSLDSSWGALVVDEILEDLNYRVHIHTEPLTRCVVSSQYINENYILKTDRKWPNI